MGVREEKEGDSFLIRQLWVSEIGKVLGGA